MTNKIKFINFLQKKFTKLLLFVDIKMSRIILRHFDHKLFNKNFKEFL